MLVTTQSTRMRGGLGARTMESPPFQVAKGLKEAWASRVPTRKGRGLGGQANQAASRHDMMPSGQILFHVAAESCGVPSWFHCYRN
jgi:hypothetical protein